MSGEISIAEYKKHLASKPKSKTAEKAFAFFEACLKEHGLKFKREFLIIPDRKFRADYYVEINTNHPIYDKRLCIEYDGLQMGDKQSRHTSVSGFAKDQEKFNLAAIHGFVVLRYCKTNYTDFSSHLKMLLNN